LDIYIKGRKIRVYDVPVKELPGRGYGAFLPDKKEIRIKQSLGPKRYAKTMIHELMHAIVDINKLDKYIGYDTEEFICEAAEVLGKLYVEGKLQILLEKGDK